MHSVKPASRDQTTSEAEYSKGDDNKVQSTEYREYREYRVQRVQSTEITEYRVQRVQRVERVWQGYRQTSMYHCTVFDLLK